MYLKLSLVGRSLVMTVLLFASCNVQLFAQAIPFGGIKANFGIDADVSANRLQATSGTPGGTDDWFRLPGYTGSGIGVIDTTGAAALYAFYNVAANINNTFIRRTPYSYYGTANSRLMLDGQTISGVGFELYQNQPNPFINRTFIGFHLPEAATATLTVYDETGRVVFTQQGDYAKGYNAVTLDRALLNTTGVLYYTLTAGDDTASRKMIQTRL